MGLTAVPPEKLNAQELIEKAKRRLVGNYKQAPIVLERGQGIWVWDVEGKKYMDLIGGVATCALGHCHPQVVAALKAQADKLWHVSNAFYIRPQIELAEKLTAASGLDRAFFCNSGAEANEALLKLARKYQKENGRPERFHVITFENSFHGRTLATVAATGQKKHQNGFEPLPAGFVHVPYGDIEAVKQAITKETAAILVEPIQGEGGVRPAPAGYLKALRQLCDEQKLLLLVDEIQTGMGRTGKPFGFQHDGILPDAISIAKALGNGIPVGGILAREQVAAALTPGSHGSTFGGNPLATATANAVVDIVMDPKMLESVARKGERLLAGLRGVAERNKDKVKDVRGRGLLAGVELLSDAAPFGAKCRDQGLLLNLAGDRTLRFAPPYIATEGELDEGVALFEKALRS
ncbi:MAG: acetylornithine transaminase [Myxococcaceae bacterium]